MNNPKAPWRHIMRPPPVATADPLQCEGFFIFKNGKW